MLTDPRKRPKFTVGGATSTAVEWPKCTCVVNGHGARFRVKARDRVRPKARERFRVEFKVRFRASVKSRDKLS